MLGVGSWLEVWILSCAGREGRWMKKVWFFLDPECGLQEDHHGGTYRYEDGKTLAEDWPEAYFQAPVWAAVIFRIACWIKGRAANLVYRWYKSGGVEG